MKWVFAAVLAIALTACAHSPKVDDTARRAPVAGQVSTNDLALWNALVDRWVSLGHQTNIVHFVRPDILQLAVVPDLRARGFDIRPTTEHEAFRVGDSRYDESYRWVRLSIEEVWINGGKATVKISTSWNGGFSVDEYRFIKVDGRWEFANVKNLMAT